MNKRELIKKGFFYGIGFIIPMIIMFILSGVIIKLSKSNSTQNHGYVTDDVKIEIFRDQKKGEKVWVLGEIKNYSDAIVSSVRLEAEFMDDQGMFVYDCGENVIKDLRPGQKENFLIICGCSGTSFPPYKDVTVDVVRVYKY